MGCRLPLLLLFASVSALLSAETDRYRVMWRDNPATTMVIGWNQASGSAPSVYYDTQDHGSNTSAYRLSARPAHQTSAKGMQNYFARLTGLTPNTVYYFVIRDSESTSRTLSFKTAPADPNTPMSIIAGGDSRNNRKGRLNANILVSKLRPDFVLFGGDMTGGDTAAEWRDWMLDWQRTIASDGRMTPIVATRGNHEKSNRTIIDLFDVPSDNVYYALTFGGDLLRVYTLNSLIAPGGDQQQWLARDLKANQHVQFRMAQYHFPMRPHTARKKENNAQMVSWATLFHKYELQLAVESDAHVVKTTYPIRPSNDAGSHEGFIRDDESGTVYVGEGCWGAPLRRNDDDKPWTRHSGSFNQFKWIKASSDGLMVYTIKTDNAEQVGTSNDLDRMSLPADTDFWMEPIHIKKKSLAQRTTPQRASVPVHRVSNRVGATTPTRDYLYFGGLRASAEADLNVSVEWHLRHAAAGARYQLRRCTPGNGCSAIAEFTTAEATSPDQLLKVADPYAILLAQPDVSYELAAFYPHTLSSRVRSQPLGLHDDIFANRIETGTSKIAKVQYRLNKASQVFIQLHDAYGNSVYKSEYHNQPAGNYLKTLNLQHLERGRYLLTIRIGQSIQMRRLLLLDSAMR